MTKRFGAASLWLFAALVAGCGASSTTRPVIHDERGRAVSELVFPPDEREVVLPLTFDGALLFADDVKINGRHVGSFVIDTGAMCSALDRAAAEKLGLMSGGKRLRDREDSKLRRPDGLFHIDSLDVGGVGVRNHVIAVVDLSSVRARRRPNLAGVIGADVWAMMPFTVDYRARQVVFHARPHFRPPPTTQAVASSISVRDALKAPPPFSLANPRAGSPTVPVRVNGQTTDALLDTASGASIVLMPRFVNRHPHFVRSDRLVARAAGAGGGVGMAGYGLVAADIESVDALGVRFTDVRGGLAVIDEVAREHSSAVLGTRLLSHLRLTFDYAAGKVWAEVNGGVK